jgi:hypothetical protein
MRERSAWERVEGDGTSDGGGSISGGVVGSDMVAMVAGWVERGRHHKRPEDGRFGKVRVLAHVARLCD